MSSPTSPSSPTRTASNIFAPSSPFAMPTGPVTLSTTPLLISTGHLDVHAEHPLRKLREGLLCHLGLRRWHEDDQRDDGRLQLVHRGRGKALARLVPHDYQVVFARIEKLHHRLLCLRPAHRKGVFDAQKAISENELLLPDHCNLPDLSCSPRPQLSSRQNYRLNVFFGHAILFRVGYPPDVLPLDLRLDDETE